MTNMINIKGTSQEELLKIFKLLPSYCGCTSCCNVKEKVKSLLGVKEFKKLAKKSNISF